MRLVIGDIHGNREALDKILEFHSGVQTYADMKREFDLGKVFSAQKLKICKNYIKKYLRNILMNG